LIKNPNVMPVSIIWSKSITITTPCNWNSIMINNYAKML